MRHATRHKEHPPVPPPNQPVEPDAADFPVTPLPPDEAEGPGDETVRRH
jgi:hypothetical protein